MRRHPSSGAWVVGKHRTLASLPREQTSKSNANVSNEQSVRVSRRCALPFSLQLTSSRLLEIGTFNRLAPRAPTLPPPRRRNRRENSHFQTCQRGSAQVASRGSLEASSARTSPLTPRSTCPHRHAPSNAQVWPPTLNSPRPNHTHLLPKQPFTKLSHSAPPNAREALLADPSQGTRILA